MPHRRAGCLVPLGALAVVAVLSVDPSRAAEGEGVLVLRNGNVLKGTVAREGDQYRIDMLEARLRVPVAQVERHCQTVDEAYEQRRASRVGRSADAHLELARWCLRNGMLEHAAREVLDARTLDPGHPALGRIGEQLGLLLKARAVAQQPPPAGDDAAAAAGVQPVAAPSAASAPSEGETPPPLSDEARAQFVRSIQPMLIHSCSTGGCHQAGSRHQLQLDRWALEGAGSAAIVRRNLASVASLIDHEDPASSPLVQWGRQAHGGSGTTKPSTPLAPYQAALLLEWLHAAAGVKPAPVEPAAADTAAPANARAEFRQPIPPSSIPGVDAALAAELDASFEAAMGGAAEAEAKPADKPYVPRDAFDPEVFNRRFGGNSKSEARNPKQGENE